MMLRIASRVPGPIGAKTSETVQLEAGETAEEQLLVRLKSEGLGPLKETEET